MEVDGRMEKKMETDVRRDEWKQMGVAGGTNNSSRGDQSNLIIILFISFLFPFHKLEYNINGYSRLCVSYSRVVLTTEAYNPLKLYSILQK